MFIMYLFVGGVVVKFFSMYYNVFDLDLFMWIVLEFYFKCFVVGGFECVYEIVCCYCNEGISMWYNFEFFMFEFY